MNASTLHTRGGVNAADEQQRMKNEKLVARQTRANSCPTSWGTSKL